MDIVVYVVAMNGEKKDFSTPDNIYLEDFLDLVKKNSKMAIGDNPFVTKKYDNVESTKGLDLNKTLAANGVTDGDVLVIGEIGSGGGR